MVEIEKIISASLIFTATILCASLPCWATGSADLNGDSQVDFLDFAILANQWLQPVAQLDQNDLLLDSGSRNDYAYYNLNQPIAAAPYKAGDVVWRCQMDDESKWATYACTLQDINDDSIAREYSRSDGKMIKQVPTGTYVSAYAYYFFDQDGLPPPLEKCYCKIIYYVADTVSLPAQISFFICGKNSDGAPTRMFVPLPITPGPHNVEFCLSALGQINEGYGGPNPPADGLIADFNNLSYIMLDTSGDPGIAVYWDSIEFIRNADRPKMVLTFDDGYLNQYTVVRPILNARNIKAGFYVIHKRVLDPNYGNGYMHLNQILQLQAEGHLIGNHTVDHESVPAIMNYTPWQLTRQVAEGRMWLKSEGIGTGRNYYAQPNGSALFAPPYEKPGSNQQLATHRRDWLSYMCSLNLHTRMTGYAKWVDGEICSSEQSRMQRHVFPNPGNFRNLGYSIRPDNYATAQYILDAAIRDNGLVSFYWHQIGPGTSYEMSEQDFTAILDYAIAHNFEFVTWADLTPELKGD